MTLQITHKVAGEVRGLIAKKRIKHKEVAQVLHVSPMAVSRRMRGEVSFTAEDMLLLASFLDVPVGALYGETSSQSTPVESASPHADSAGVSFVTPQDLAA
jgi:transcriptional regulator with XRE-family HTH domain